ncbi:MAG: ATP-binding protein [Rhizobiaceae bacterium]|nr:ATP-binding protein [Rhizobiaceae bacterium]
MPDDPIYRGFRLREAIGRFAKQAVNEPRMARERHELWSLAETVFERLSERGLADEAGVRAYAAFVAEQTLRPFVAEGIEAKDVRYFEPLTEAVHDLINYEELFEPPDLSNEALGARSAVWEAEDRLRAMAKFFDHFDDATEDLVLLVCHLIEPIVTAMPALVAPASNANADIAFPTPLLDNLSELPATVERLMQLPFAPELDKYALTTHLRDRLEYNLIIASGGTPSDRGVRERSPKLPTRAPTMPPKELVTNYLGGTPLSSLFEVAVPIVIPTETRFEHQHIVAGSGHGKTQTIQHLILHDLDRVAAGRASVIVIDSQADLINTIAGMEVFAPGGALHDRLCLIDPTDVEWPVALNLFDVGQGRLQRYSALDRERLTNSILELYDFVLGSLLDAGMTQKQSVIFRYVTRLLINIPGATIHTLRELLEDDGYDKYAGNIAKLEGSARAFFENEFRGKEFQQTRRQVLRRLYGILENQTFERMFSHPKSKLDIFAEMNAGKVILINTAKDLLKETGTEIFGRFFIAMITQAAQERAVLAKNKRLPTFVYVDEASDYFDRNIGIILSQARKNRVGMVLSHQYLGQLEPKLQEAISANTAIKFAGGVSAKDARALAGDLRTEASMIENQDRLSFAAYVKGVTRRAVSIGIQAGLMEDQPRMSVGDQERIRELMRGKHAVHHSEVRHRLEPDDSSEPEEFDDEPDTGEPMRWE